MNYHVFILGRIRETFDRAGKVDGRESDSRKDRLGRTHP
jgi:hypothetical protein